MTVWQWLMAPPRWIFLLGVESSAHRLMESHEWRAARDVYTRLLQWSPRQASFHCELGVAHLMLNEYEPAEDHLRAAIGLAPGCLRAQEFLGLLLANAGKAEEARAVWESLIAAAEKAAIRQRWLLTTAAEQAREARDRIECLGRAEFTGFPIDPGYAAYPGSSPGSVD